MSSTTTAPKVGATTGFVRACGAAIAILSIAAAVLISLPWPRGASRSVLGELGGAALLAAILVVFVVAWRTRATGSSPVWLGALVLGSAAALVAGVTVFIVPAGNGVDVSDIAFLVTAVLAYIVSVGILAAGRWTGAARYLPIAAQSWPIIVFVALILDWPEDWSWYGPIGMLLLLHAVLGVVLAVRPALATGTGR